MPTTVSEDRCGAVFQPGLMQAVLQHCINNSLCGRRPFGDGMYHNVRKGLQPSPLPHLPAIQVAESSSAATSTGLRGRLHSPCTKKRRFIRVVSAQQESSPFASKKSKIQDYRAQEADNGQHSILEARRQPPCKVDPWRVYVYIGHIIM